MTKLYRPGAVVGVPAKGRIYHYHLKKCGGTTLNAWLDTLSPAARVYNPHWRPGSAATEVFPIQTNGFPANMNTPSRAPDISHSVFYWSDVVHSHAPLRRHAPRGTFCLTLLRDPVARLTSQFKDWRGLTDDDLMGYNETVRACIRATRRLSLASFLDEYGQGTAQFLMDNYMTRALAASRGGRNVIENADLQALLHEALQVVDDDYDFVGIVDQYDVTINALCAALGVPPAGDAIRLNARDPVPDDMSLAISPDMAARFTGYDQILYDYALQKFAPQQQALAAAYTAARFEAVFAESLLSGLRAIGVNDAAQYSVRSPVYGTWLHQRDGGKTGDNAVWTRSGCRAALYVPVPAAMPLELLLWIRGYAEPAQRTALRVLVDGAETPWALVTEPGYADLLVIPYLSQRGFVRLELEVPDATGPAGDDTRARGICFDTYGWRPV